MFGTAKECSNIDGDNHVYMHVSYTAYNQIEVHYCAQTIAGSMLIRSLNEKARNQKSNMEYNMSNTSL